jgi:hypothetical protein
MYLRIFYASTVFGLLGGAVHAQTIERRANFTGGGGPEGKCTVEVIVDGAAEVEIRGDRALLRNLRGQTPQWRRFDCTSPMPGNLVNFRFQGVDGRGRQSLASDPRRGGPIVVRIEDPDNGAEGYTFDVFWQGGGGFPPQGGPGPDRGFGSDRGRDRGYRGRTSADDAVRICQDSVRAQAHDRLRGVPINFERTTIDDNPGRQDWVVGTFEARRGPGRPDLYSFSCSVDFQSGRVRSADFRRADRDRR